MTQLTKDKIFEKLENLKEYLGYLHQLKSETGDEQKFVADFHLFSSTERYLQLSVQVIIDVVHLVIIDLGKKRPEDNYEAVSIVHENGVITSELADVLTAMVGLRNILVHEYGKVDKSKIYKILVRQLNDLEEFQRQMVNYLRK